jgi:hypothetical protein
MLENTLDKYVATTPPERLALSLRTEYRKGEHPVTATTELIPPQELFGPDISSFPLESLFDFRTRYPYSLAFKHVLDPNHGEYLAAESIDGKIKIAVMETMFSMIKTDYLRVLPTYDKYADIDFPTYIEGFLDYAKRVLYYRTADWSLLPIYIRGFWAFITVFATVDLQMTLQDILAVNEAKLRKRYPSGSFSPEDATRKADNDT